MIDKIMNRNVIKLLLAVLGMGLGLVSCNQQLEQEGYSDIIIGHDGKEIKFYPLGENLTITVDSGNMWAIDDYDIPNGINVTWDETHIKLKATQNLQQDRDGFILICNDVDEQYISLVQECVNFDIEDEDGNLVENGSTIESIGGRTEFAVTSNVRYQVSLLENRESLHLIDTIPGIFTVVDGASTTLNGSDISAGIKVDLLDKAGIEKKYMYYYTFTLLQKAFIFKWAGTTGNNMMAPKSFTADFNDTRRESYYFNISGDWTISKGNADWITVSDLYGNPITEGSDGSYVICLTVAENTDTSAGRNGSVKIVADKYPDNPLVINVTQGQAPKIGIDPDTMDLPEGKSKNINVNLDLTDGMTHEVTWTITEGNGIVSLSKTTGSGISVTGLKEGQATVNAAVKVNDKYVTTLTCHITVVREYDDTDGRDQIGDDSGEW